MGFSIRKARIVSFVALALALGSRAVAQEDLPRTAAYLELEGGAAMFQSSSMRSDFPVGLQMALGVEFATGNDLRVRLRPQAGLRFFSKYIEQNTNEHFRILRLGGTISYDAYFMGQTSFFPYVSMNYNWVSNYDAETVGYDSEGQPNIVYSDSFIKGGGFSTELGLKVQYRRFYVKGGFDLFKPILRVQFVEEDEQSMQGEGDRQVFIVRHQREPFNLNAFNLSIGYILF